MTTMRTMIWIAAGLLIGSVWGPNAWAEEPPPTPREREIKELEARHAAEQYEGQLNEARAQFEKAEQRYRQMAEQYEQAQAAYEEGREAYGARRERGPSLDAAEARVVDLERQLHNLRMRQVDLEATMQQLEVSGRPNDAQKVQQELIELHRQLQMTEFELQQQQRELDRLHERRELGHMQDRLNFIGHWRDVAFDPQQAVMMATQSLVEMHMGGGDAKSAAHVLEQLLEKVNWLGARTALRFALKDLYGELERPDQAKEQMIQVILENAGGKDAE